MIIDLITNSEKIIDFVKEKEGFGGKVEEKDGRYKLINVQIGYEDRFSTDISKFMRKNKIKSKEYGFEIRGPRNNLVVIYGKLY